VVLHHRFGSDVARVRRDGTRIAIEVPGWKSLAFNAPTASVADAIVALDGDGASFEDLTTVAAAGLDASEAGRWVAYTLGRFRRARLLAWIGRRAGAPIVTFRSLASGFGPAEGDLPDRAMTLSRFAYVRRDGADLVLESPETPCRAILGAAPS